MAIVGPWENDGKSAWHFEDILSNDSVMDDPWSYLTVLVNCFKCAASLRLAQTRCAHRGSIFKFSPRLRMRELSL